MARGSVEFELTVPVDVLQAAGRRDVLSKLSNVIAYFSQYVFIGSTIKNDNTKQRAQDKGAKTGRCSDGIPADAGLSEGWQDVGSKLAEIIT